MTAERVERPRIEPVITPQSLLADNQTSKATEGKNEWLAARGQGELLLVSGCSDARVDMSTFLQTPRIIDKTSIAGSGITDRFKFLITNPGNNAIIAWQHFNKYEVGDDGIFRGCGGLAAKRDSERSGGIGPEEDGVHAFIRDDIHGTHVMSQGYRIALEKSRTLEKRGIFDKPVVAAAVEHSSGLVIPFALIENGGRKIQTSFNLYHLYEELDCSHLYENGEVPALNPEVLPANIQEALARNQEFVKTVGSTLDFSDGQQVHNPDAVVISTSTIPVSVRYPETFGAPNTAFTLGLPYDRLEGGESSISEKDMKIVLNQAHYPIMHANKAGEGDAFSKTNLMLIETKSLEMSAAVARYMYETAPWMREWMGAQGRKVFIAATDEGVTSEMTDFTANLAA